MDMRCWAGQSPFYSRQEPTLETFGGPREDSVRRRYVCSNNSHKGIILVARQRSKRELTLCFDERGGVPGRLCRGRQQALARVNSGSVDLELVEGGLMHRPTPDSKFVKEMSPSRKPELLPVIC